MTACAGLMVVLAVSCGADDREMRPPSASQTTTTPTTAAAADTGGGVGTATELVMQLTSTGFGADQPIPEQYTCQGRDVSPPLEWANLPAGVTELAVAMVDRDAENFVHWLVTGIPPTVGGMAEGEVPAGAVEGPNSFGNDGWAGPCPPDGSGLHHYEFRLLALSEPPNLEADADATAAYEQLARLPAVATAILTGTVAAAS